MDRPSSGEQFADAGEVRICFESIGDPDDPTALVLVGLGAQLVLVSDDFCNRLAGRGFRVLRCDNRDSGRSTVLSGHGVPSIWRLAARNPRLVPYTLDDMAKDSVGLLDALEVQRAHLIGFSMGGMIAQVMAVRHPDRVASLASIMSSTGSLRKGWPALRFLRQAGGTPSSEAEAIRRRISAARARAAGGLPDDETELRHAARRSQERSGDESGSRRQLAAMLASGNRTASLRQIAAPTLVIHGLADRFVHPSGGRATAAAIPGAKLCLIEDMAHNLPPALRPRVIDLIAENAASALGSPSLLDR